MNKNKISGITLGVRFNRSFRVPDIAGEMIDDILNNSESPFDHDKFPRIRELAGKEKVLINEDDEYIRINNDDVILYLKVDNNFDAIFKLLKEKILPYYKDQLFKKYEIKNIKRIGIVFHHKIDKIDKISEIIKSLTSDKIDEANNVSLSFSKKLTSNDGLIKSGVIDYKNTIYTFEQNNDDFIFNFDYQCYYNPVHEDLRDTGVENLPDEGFNFLNGVYNDWLNSYEQKS